MISFADVERMLDQCAPNHEIQLKTHFRIIRFNNLTYPSFPKHDQVKKVTSENSREHLVYSNAPVTSLSSVSLSLRPNPK